MNHFKVDVVKIGGGYLKAIVRDGEETVIGRDYGELIGRLKRIGFKEPLLLPGKKKAA